MNGQNNYNFQNNSFNNSNNNPMHPVKNRFFNQELFNDANLSDVGTSTTEQASNYSLDNFVMGSDFTNNSVNVNNNNRVSGASNNDVPVEAPKQNQFSSIFSQDLLEDVNASVYPPNTVELTQSNNVNDTLDSYSEAEVLDTLEIEELSEELSDVETLDDDFKNDAPVLGGVNNFYNNTNTPTTNNINQTNNNSLIGAAAPIFNQNVSAPEPTNLNELDNNLISQQPLSLNSLGASPVNQQDIPDIEDNSKYFPSPDPIIKKENEMIAQAQNKTAKTVTAIDSILDDEVIVIDETALIKSYVGANYNKYMKSNFSAFAMIFGSLAFFCRGLYLMGLILFAFQVIVLFIFRDIPYIILAILVILAFIMAMIINPLYFSKVKAKVKSVRKKHPKVSQGELNNLCAKLGKNNMALALLVQIALVGITVFGAIKILGTDYFVGIYEKARDKVLKVNKEEVKFDGNIKYNDLDIEEYFSITVPDVYSEDDITDFSYYYVTEGEGENNRCSFNFGGVDGFSSSSELLEKMAVYYETDEEVDSVKFNGLDWYLLYIERPEGKVYYRATDVDGKVILFEFLSGADTPVGVCDSQIVILLDSIEIK